MFGSMFGGGDLFSNSEFELNREQHGGVISLWRRSSRSAFSSLDGALSLNGDVRTTMLGAELRARPARSVASGASTATCNCALCASIPT